MANQNFIHRLFIFTLPLLFEIKFFITTFRKKPRAVRLTKPNYPAGIGIEVTNICNANCVFCAYQYQERPKSIMPHHVFQKTIDEYIAMGKAHHGIGLTPIVGDPLVDPNLEDKILYANHCGIKLIHITTNAILLTKERFEKLVHSGLSHITISMSNFDSNEYEHIYRSPHYLTVLKNIRGITRSNLFQKCSVQIALRTASFFPWIKREYWEFKIAGIKFFRSYFFDDWSGSVSSKNFYGLMMLRPLTKKRLPCSYLYGGPLISVSGDVTACGCRDLEVNSDLYLGNIIKTPLEKILAPAKMEALRNRFIKGNLPNICKDCRIYSPVT